MPNDLHDWLRRIKGIEREHASTRLAIDRLLEEARRDSTILTGDLKPHDITLASERLEGTYIIRLFAEYETGLRLFWKTIRETEPPTQDLLNGIAARRGIPPARIANAQAVREHRNALVHERDEEVVPIPIAEARGYLCRFFAFLPPTW
jgi:hypothetical protein